MTLDVNVPFPLSIVLNRKAVTKYQLLFRHLFGYHSLLRHLGKLSFFFNINIYICREIVATASDGIQATFAASDARRIGGAAK